VEQTQRLLEYQRTTEQRTRVIDHVSDYALPGEDTVQDLWLSQEEKQIRQKQRQDRLHELEQSERRSGKARVITLDLKNKVVTVAKETPSLPPPLPVKDTTMYAHNPWIPPTERPVYVATTTSTPSTATLPTKSILQHDWTQE
jgi:hypothetical protein